MSGTSDANPDPDLVAAAIAVRVNAYVPYSGYHVGAAVRGVNGKIYTGVNVENAAYPEGTCAEAGAIAAMVMDGEREIVEIAVAGPEGAIITPCGGCRQKLREFSRADVPVHSCDPAGHKQTVTIGDLLPHAFSPEHLS